MRKKNMKRDGYIIITRGSKIQKTQGSGPTNLMVILG
jgi:hypothetical protein